MQFIKRLAGKSVALSCLNLCVKALAIWLCLVSQGCGKRSPDFSDLMFPKMFRHNELSLLGGLSIHYLTPNQGHWSEISCDFYNFRLNFNEIHFGSYTSYHGWCDSLAGMKDVINETKERYKDLNAEGRWNEEGTAYVMARKSSEQYIISLFTFCRGMYVYEKYTVEFNDPTGAAIIANLLLSHRSLTWIETPDGCSCRELNTSEKLNPITPTFGPI